MPLIPFLRRGAYRLGNRVAIGAGSIRLGAGVRRKFPASWVIVAWDGQARRLVLISALQEEHGAAYPVGRRGRIYCGAALEHFGLAAVDGVFRVERIEEGQLSIVLPKRALRRRGNG